jgi:predicted CoA-binding protein
MESPGERDAIALLMSARTLAVVGLDSRADRPAWGVAKYLREQGYRIVPVHRGRFAADEILGERACASLREVPGPVDLVVVFVRPDDTDDVIDEAIAIGAKGVWLQQGITNEAGLVRARAAGLVAIQDRCTRVVHAAQLRQRRPEGGQAAG